MSFFILAGYRHAVLNFLPQLYSLDRKDRSGRLCMDTHNCTMKLQLGTNI